MFNKRILGLIEQAQDQGPNFHYYDPVFLKHYTEAVVEAVLDEVQERAYYTGDRDWSDEVDRPWIQLEFGYGKLAEAQHDSN